MANIRILATAIVGSSLAAVPAHAGGLLGGGAANCLCQAVGGVLGGGAPTISRPDRSVTGILSRGTGQRRQVSGSITNSVNGALGVTAARAAGRNHGRSIAGVGLAGTVSSVTRTAVGGQLLNKGIGLAGTSSAQGSVHSSRLVNVSILNRTGTTGRSLANVAVLNGSGGTGGKLANVSVLNKTGTTGQSLASVAVLNGSGGTSGKVVNVALLNKAGTAGHSAVNVAVLNGRGSGGGGNGGSGNGHGGTGHGGTGLGGLLGSSGNCLCETVKGVLGSANSGGGSNGGSGNGGSGSGPGGSNGGTGSGGGSNGGGTGAGTPGGGSGGNPSPARDKMDHKDLWWPAHTQDPSYRKGREINH